MKAYKGFTREIKSIWGNGIVEKCTFIPGQTIEEEGSETGKRGFHCCEYIFDCMRYYPMNGSNRFFLVEAEGDIDEDRDNRISCTRITLIRELDRKGIALEGMIYIVKHPDRDGWECRYPGVQVCRERAEAWKKDHIAIARGKDPAVRGEKGSIVGLIKEEEDGKIQNVRMLRVTKEQQGRWLGLREDGEVIQK